MKRSVVITIGITLVLLGYLTFTTVDSKTPVAAAAGTTYSGTVYVAGMGGHFAKAEVTIDPSNANEPVKIANLDRIVIGDKTSHATHDARIDVNDRNTMLWSTYILDPQGKMHVGKSDLKTGNVIKDIDITPAHKKAGHKQPIYCAS